MILMVGKCVIAFFVAALATLVAHVALVLLVPSLFRCYMGCDTLQIETAYLWLLVVSIVVFFPTATGMFVLMKDKK